MKIIPGRSLSCLHIKTLQPMNTTDQVLDSGINTDINKTEIEIVDSGKFILLFILSFSFYGLWWMYKSWKFFKEKESLDILPAARAIFAIIFLFPLLEKIKGFAKTTGYNSGYSSGLLTFAFIFLNIAASQLPEPFWLISYLSFVFLIAPVNAFNFAIENSGQYNAWRGGFNNRQIGILVVGVIVWVLALIGLFSAEPY